MNVRAVQNRQGTPAPLAGCAAKGSFLCPDRSCPWVPVSHSSVPKGAQKESHKAPDPACSDEVRRTVNQSLIHGRAFPSKSRCPQATCSSQVALRTRHRDDSRPGALLYVSYRRIPLLPCDIRHYTI